MTNLKLAIVFAGVLTYIAPIAYSVVNGEAKKEKTILVDSIKWQVINSEDLPNGMYSVKKTLLDQGKLVEKFNFGGAQHFLVHGLDHIAVGQHFQQLTIDESEAIRVHDSTL